MTAALAPREFDVKRAVMVGTTDIIFGPLTGTVAVTLALAEKRQHG